jgi:hypothetical protein
VSAVLAGCGGASSINAAAPAEQASVPTVTVKSVTPPSPAAVGQRVKKSAKRSAKGSVLVRRSDVVHAGHVVQVGAGTPDASGDDTSPPGQHTGQDPCTLVSKATAQAVVGARILSRFEAPLGPTCIFKVAHGREITIAVEPVSFSAAVHELGRRERVRVSGRPAVCGTRGMQTLFVSLHSGGVLNVTAPCRVAQRLAAKALARIHD